MISRLEKFGRTSYQQNILPLAISWENWAFFITIFCFIRIFKKPLMCQNFYLEILLVKSEVVMDYTLSKYGVLKEDIAVYI